MCISTLNILINIKNIGVMLISIFNKLEQFNKMKKSNSFIFCYAHLIINVLKIKQKHGKIRNMNKIN